MEMEIKIKINCIYVDKNRTYVIIFVSCRGPLAANIANKILDKKIKIKIKIKMKMKIKIKIKIKINIKIK